MKAALDIGNTVIKIAFFTEDRITELKYSEDFRTCCHHLAEEAVTDIVVSTVKPLSAVEEGQLKSLATTLFVSHNIQLPISINYDTKNTLGPDRLAGACAAWAQWKNENSLVIDCGTCITFDFVRQTGEFEGGSIHPGLHMRLKAMHQFTSQLPLVPVNSTVDLIGKTTTACIQSGTLYGIAAEIRGMIREYYKEAADLNVILTGGDAHFFESMLNTPIFVRQNLILEGLIAIFHHNNQ